MQVCKSWDQEATEGKSGNFASGQEMGSPLALSPLEVEMSGRHRS